MQVKSNFSQIQTNQAPCASLTAGLPGMDVRACNFRAKSRFVEFALKSDLLTRREIEEAEEIALSLGDSLETVLLRSSFLTREQYDRCIKAVAFVEKELITERLALQGLNMACKKGLSLEEGLSYFGWAW